MDLAKMILDQATTLNRANEARLKRKRDAEFYEDSSDVLDQQTDSEVVEEYRGRSRDDD